MCTGPPWASCARRSSCRGRSGPSQWSTLAEQRCISKAMQWIFLVDLSNGVVVDAPDLSDGVPQ